MRSGPTYVLCPLHRCLTLWSYDNSLLRALDVCKELLPYIDFFVRLPLLPVVSDDGVAYYSLLRS
jgi:hypothetical protein